MPDDLHEIDEAFRALATTLDIAWKLEPCLGLDAIALVSVQGVEIRAGIELRRHLRDSMLGRLREELRHAAGSHGLYAYNGRPGPPLRARTVGRGALVRIRCASCVGAGVAEVVGKGTCARGHGAVHHQHGVRRLVSSTHQHGMACLSRLSARLRSTCI